MTQAGGQHPFKLHAINRGHDRRGIRRGVSLLPSLFTLANLFCGWACVVHAMRGDIVTAAPFIGFAVVLDMLDGRIARMTGTSSDFGVQLDSLADLISFGMAKGRNGSTGPTEAYEVTRDGAIRWHLVVDGVMTMFRVEPIDGFEP